MLQLQLKFMYKKIKGLLHIFLVFSLLLFTFFTSVFAGYYQGNNYTLNSNNTITLNSPLLKISFRFTAKYTATVSKLYFFVNSFTGTPSYKISLMSNDPSSGFPLSELSVAVASSPWSAGWRSVDIPDVPLIAGTTYHFVITPLNVGSTYYITAYTNWIPHNLQLPVDLSTDTAQNYLTNNGSGWVIQNRTPIYVLEYLPTGGVEVPYQGVPYYGSSYAKAHGNGTPTNPADDYIYGEQFKITGYSFTATQIGFYMLRGGTPGSNPIYYIVWLSSGGPITV